MNITEIIWENANLVYLVPNKDKILALVQKDINLMVP